MAADVLLVTQQQLTDGWCSLEWKAGKVPTVEHHRFEVIEGPRADKTYLVKAPGVTRPTAVEQEICQRVAEVLGHESTCIRHPDPARRKVAAAWVRVCESALRGNPADRTEVLARYVELVGLRRVEVKARAAAMRKDGSK